MLQVKNIVKDYVSGSDVVHALKGVSLNFRKSEFVSILGQSGCGKTTLLNIIGGLDKYTSGDLIINGVSTKKYDDRDWDTYRNHSIGFVFQSYNLIPHQTVLANVELALTLSGVNKRERRERAINALKEVGLGDQLKKKPTEMSGGQMQRVAIARALVNNPDIILADEPTGALDTETSVQVMEILKKISKDRLIIMVTHNPELAEKYSSRIIKMLDGVVTGDSMPLSLQEVVDFQKEDKKALRSRNKKEKKPSMSFFTALSLSLKNLFTKKGRTFLTSFAGSIGIIGIALILAVSEGTTAYIDTVQEESLSSYPLTIVKENVDLSSLLTTFSSAAKVEANDGLSVYEKPVLYDLLNGVMNVETSENDLKSFKKFIDEELKKEDSELKNALSGVKYGYDLDLQIFTRSEDKIIKSDVRELFKGIFVQGDEEEKSSSASPMMTTTSVKIWQEMLSGENGSPINRIVKEQYELVYGSWPNSYDEVVLVMDKNNTLTDLTLYALGLKPKADMDAIMRAVMRGEELPERETDSFTYEEICAKEYKTVLSGDCYQYIPATGTYVDNRLTDSGLEYLYNKKGMNIKVTGIIKVGKDVNSPMLSSGIAYTHLLTEKLINGAADSPAVQAQLASPNTDIFTGLPFAENSYTVEEKTAFFKTYIEGLSEAKKAEAYVKIKSVIPDSVLQMQVSTAVSGKTRAEMEGAVSMILKEQLQMPEEMVTEYVTEMTDDEILKYYTQIVEATVKMQYAGTVSASLKNYTNTQLASMLDGEILSYTDEQCSTYYDEILEFSTSTYEKNLILLGSLDLESPSQIGLYASTFENKDVIVSEIERYNRGVDEVSKISYTDYFGILLSAITTIIDAITYVLIAFVAISLIVSSIMIAVITLISVQERTKEIGILRAIGASKKNVSSMFTAETIIIGFSSGLLGVVVSYLLTIPINLILHSLTDIGNLNAILPFVDSVVLILISIVLNLVSGLIPSRAAAKKDPVVALRTE